MTRAQIIALQSRIGTTPDGFWGPRSIAACQRHLKRLMPSPNPWPKPDMASMVRFYGKPGDQSNLVNLPVAGLGLRYAGKPVRTVLCHRLIADPLLGVLETIAAGPAAWILEQYAGCFNYRPMRGSSAWSKHAWGAAIDFAPATNGLRTHWPTRADMPFDAMCAFATEGFLAAGAFWGRDAMHFEASRV